MCERMSNDTHSSFGSGWFCASNEGVIVHSLSQRRTSLAKQRLEGGGGGGGSKLAGGYSEKFIICMCPRGVQRRLRTTQKIDPFETDV